MAISHPLSTTRRSDPMTRAMSPPFRSCSHEASSTQPAEDQRSLPRARPDQESARRSLQGSVYSERRLSSALNLASYDLISSSVYALAIFDGRPP
jgi:hypothetical protein